MKMKAKILTFRPEIAKMDSGGFLLAQSELFINA